MHDDRARSIHAATLVADTHSDIPTDLHRRRAVGETGILGKCHLPGLREGGVSLCAMAVNNDSFVSGFQPDAALRRVVSMLDAVEEEVAETPEFALVRNSQEILDARAHDRIAVPLGLEGGACIGESIETIRVLHRLGVCSVTLTWNYRNGIGDGIAEEGRGGGLSRFGVQAVKEMQRLGIIVDVSHMTQVGVQQVLAVVERPIIASHSNARALCDHPRNLSDHVIEAIARTGGVVGVCFYPAFLSHGRATLDHVLDQIEYLIRVGGEDHVVIGPDFVDYLDTYLDDKLNAAGVGYLANADYPEGISSVSQFHSLTSGLISRGFTEGCIHKLLGLNYLRVVQQAVD